MKDHPLKVMILHAPTGMAGAEGVILNINRFMAGSPRVRIFNCPFINYRRGPSHYLRELDARGIEYQSIPLIRRFDYRYVRETRRLMNKFHIDLIHSHGYRSDITALWAANGSIPVVSTIHGFTANSSRVKIYEFMQRIFLRHMRMLMPVSIPIEQRLIKMGIPENRIRCLPNIVDHETITALRPSPVFSDFGIKDSVTKLVFVGRLSIEKGLDILINACGILKQRGTRFFLLIIGEGPLKSEYENRINTLSMASEIKLMGYRRNAVKITAACDFFVLPSRTEGIPLAVLEAMALGRPVVASKVGGLPQLIQHKQNGLLVTPEDAENLANTLEWGIRNKDAATEIGKKAKQRIQKEYSPDKWAAELTRNYYFAANRRLI